ncbi:Na+/H+ antiporter [Phyllobacterium endophyticum]|uniref:Na+/H+ antiporter n=1 Tax=Phyllobacterium endophyticum TaxID=1149773 RepID=A0A2P7B2H1_9HYPH|nr:Na+/H+ antiporter [Phyllobacterium endophyticum]MBB3235664.1 CPA1 family monovalent cation:H+ antiporter [Phyllobacterium endophyticum]PSH60654.1 Na+/H+ antiporter [Phyllobacterium endophyticum]TXR48307.1 Na+/H+ antiporter [Phyllobacterium endophyticum]TYR41865.1 Na+/H+ antiporter [Phyllobacterium endophyticum]
METITIVLLMLLAVVVSDSLIRVSPVPLPLPLVQIGLGAVIASVTSIRVELEPDIFFLLFLPPLLFLDGWRIPKEGLFRDKGIILEMALGLVIFTVVGLGFFVHWMIPSVPLPVAFALAAILSPTDPIAVSAIAARVPIPSRMMHILEGESLLNDASGLVCMRFAVAAMLTGTFSLPQAFFTFLWLAFAGIAIGVGVTIGVTKGKAFLARHLGEESGSQILISLLIPFGAYLLAEHLHASGILAAVAAGITMSYAENTGQSLALTRVRRAAVWDTAQFAANGAIFVLLGEQLPSIFMGAVENVQHGGGSSPWWLGVYVVIIYAVLVALRFLWVWASWRIALYRPLNHGGAAVKPSWRLVATMSFAGVRGAITLAGILTLPLLLNDGTLFPARDLVIFLASGVIILSLITAGICLPRLLQNIDLPVEDSHQRAEDYARIAAAEAAIMAIEKAQHDLATGRADADAFTDVATQIMELYRKRIDGRMHLGEEREQAARSEEIGKQLHITALKAERQEIYRLVRARRLESTIASKMVRDIDLLEARYG